MRLSVCIPTHHGRCELLAEALESIAAQAASLPGQIEIVVSDNASRDGTPEMVARFAAEHPALPVIYARNERDIRLANIARVVERANGDWCWLFGSDDVMADGGLKTVLQTVSCFPDASGLGFRKANFSHDMTTQLQSDAAAFYPRTSETTLFDDYRTAMREVAFLFAFMGTNVVKRDRFLAAAARKGAAAVERHPSWPHLIILSDVLRHDPAWVWRPQVLVRARAGRPYLVERDRGGPNLARMHALLAVSIRKAWAEIAGPDTELFDALLAKSYAVSGNDAVVRNLKTLPAQTLARDLLLLGAFCRAFWRVPEFRRDCLPLLLVPAAVYRRSLARNRSTSMSRLEPGESRTRLEAELSHTATPGGAVDIRCTITNLGPRTLIWSMPHPIAIGYRWFDCATGAVVKSDGRTILQRPLAPGATIVIHDRQNVPWHPGRYEVRISPVQEFVAWFDDLDPDNGVRTNVELAAH